ncbi:serine hydrolase [Leptobacterium flavescens]|uniref:Serine hydrolase n=1 Tax=Leptobacterium flavescens TaxID=472055 RepID=A0A6P0URV3_9FLAO|nr:serine hydrolase domain-containing protein [Leptobacterium flavescens]NER14708.1 serine hydrolase [Leptobacterium flavescens]
MKAGIHLKVILFPLLLSFLLPSVHGQSLEEKIDRLLQEKYKTDGPGATALVAKNGKVIYSKAFGMADLELNVPMKPEHIFEIGSITKQFTAVSVLMLVEQGKLNLDDEITVFIPDYPTHGKRITVHHLLTHTSGIKSYTSMPVLREIATKDLTPMELIDVFKDEPMDFDPGEAYRYNNSGYILLGYIIEKLSGESYANFIQKNIFDKAGMNSSYYANHFKLIKGRASGYMRSNEYINANYISFSIPYAAGSLMSNTNDLLKWQQAINNNTFVKEETIKKAFTNYTLNNGEPIYYGYGWAINEINGSPSREHGGGIFGFTTQGIYIPGQDVYVAVLTNCSCNSPGDVTTKIAALAIGKPFPEPENIISLSESQLKKWLGKYKFEDEAIRSITLENGQLFSQREGSNARFKILPLSPDHFYFEDGFIEYKFSKSKGKREVLFKNRINHSKGVEIK